MAITTRSLTDSNGFSYTPIYRAMGGAFVSTDGTSLTQQAITGTASKLSSTNYSVIAWVQFLLNNRIRHINFRNASDPRGFSGNNNGVSGEKLSDILDRRAITANATRHNILLLEGGTNDMADGDKEGLLAKKMQLVDYHLSLGTPVILLSVPIRDTDVTNYLPGSQARSETFWVNAQTKKECDKRAGVRFIDVNEVLIDRSDPDGAPIADAFRDGTHWAVIGAYRVALMVVDAIEEMIMLNEEPALSVDGAYHATHNPFGNLHPNPLCLGTGGTLGASGVSGVVADDMGVLRSSGDAEVDCSKEAAGDGSEFQVLTFTPGATESLFYYYTTPSDLTHGLAAGTFITGSHYCEIIRSNAWKGVTQYLKDQGTNGMISYGMEPASPTLFYPQEFITGVNESQPIELVTGSTAARWRVEIRIGATGAGATNVSTLKIGRCTFNAVEDPRVTLNYTGV